MMGKPSDGNRPRSVSEEVTDRRCPRCDAPRPELHPAVQHEGEVQPCPHPWHDPIGSEGSTE